MKRLSKLSPVLVVIAVGGWLGLKAISPQDPVDGMAIYRFGQIPVVYQGRVKPLDSLARNTMRVLSDRQSFVDDSAETKPAIRWLLDVMAHAPAAQQHRIFRIVNREVLDTLGLEARLKPSTTKYRYAAEEIAPALSSLQEQYIKTMQLKPAQWDVYQRKIVEAGEHWLLYLRLYNRDIPFVAPPLSADETWKSLPQVLHQSEHAGKLEPAVASFEKILETYRDGDPVAFRSQIMEHQLLLRDALGDGEIRKVKFEFFFNHFSPFYHCAVLYLVAFVLSAIAWLRWTQPLNRAVSWLIAVTLLVHTFALISRIYISGRPPVTNLYSSAIFIGWGCVVIGLILEWIYRLGVGNVVAAAAGFMTLIIAHNLAGDGDTFEMLQAVLDTQFWLATHVTCVTLGYATTFLGGFLGLVYIVRGVLTRSMTAPLGTELARMIYGILCFALFFSFVGTVLGGLWADDSWGRFWGWDPKENGALMIVLWNALVLHSRWGGIVKARGMALLSVFGNVVTSWSWFGTNELGVGLHAYGFTEGRAFWLFLFVCSQLLVIAVGWLVPQSHWRSFSGKSSAHQTSATARSS